MRFIKLDEVIEMTGLPRASIYKAMNAGTFPKTVPVGGRAVAWIDLEVLEWMARKIEERDGN
jgi:prophage regulatory protein